MKMVFKVLEEPGAAQENCTIMILICFSEQSDSYGSQIVEVWILRNPKFEMLRWSFEMISRKFEKVWVISQTWEASKFWDYEMDCWGNES